MIYRAIQQFLSVLIFSLIYLPSSAESIREFQQRQCAKGVAESCKKAEALLEGERHANRIDELGDNFAKTVDRSEMEEENKPILNEAYTEVLEDYFKNEAENGIKRAVASDIIDLCADHYHHHWRNKKMWWPMNDAGEPDWSSIYFYIVEHYYGYCLRANNTTIQ